MEMNLSKRLAVAKTVLEVQRLLESGDKLELAGSVLDAIAAWRNLVDTATMQMASLRTRVRLLEEAAAGGFACAECGKSGAGTFVVTVLDAEDPSTQTEVCEDCHQALQADRPSLAEVVARAQNRSDTDPTWRADYREKT